MRSNTFDVPAEIDDLNLLEIAVGRVDDVAAQAGHSDRSIEEALVFAFVMNSSWASAGYVKQLLAVFGELAAVVVREQHFVPFATLPR